MENWMEIITAKDSKKDNLQYLSIWAVYTIAYAFVFPVVKEHDYTCIL